MPSAATWMQLEINTLSEVSQRKTNIMISLICGIQTMTQMNLCVKQKQIHRHEDRLLGVSGEECGGGWSRTLGLADVNYHT